MATTIAVVLVFGSPAVRSGEASCTYTVTVPGPADIWNTGGLYNIQWFKSGTCADRVDLHLIRDDEVVWTIAELAARLSRTKGRAAGSPRSPSITVSQGVGTMRTDVR